MMSRRLKHKGGFTLIELLIVVAIISIMVVAVGNTFFYVFQEQAELVEQLEIQQEANLAVESLALDAARSSAFEVKSSPAKISFVFKKTKGDPERIIYEEREGRLIRTAEWPERLHEQVLAENVKLFSAEREGALLRVRLVLEKQRYRKTFTEDYKTAFAIQEEQ